MVSMVVPIYTVKNGELQYTLSGVFLDTIVRKGVTQHPGVCWDTKGCIRYIL